MRNRFKVVDFDKRYFELDKLNPKSIYTTNIDDLIHCIYEKIDDKYINDVTFAGESFNDKMAIDYSALHGNVRYHDRKMIFDVASINNAYSSNPRIWNQLAIDFEKRITLFWGYGLQDTGVIQALTSTNTNPANHKDKWIIIRKSDDDIKVYYESLGFNIIVADTNQFLEYLTCWQTPPKLYGDQISEEISYFFNKNLVPKSNKHLPVRPILEFFSGNPPTWYDIFSNQIFKSSHFKKLKNAIYSGKNLIIQGAPVSGKTTLMMQIAVDSDSDIKLIFENLLPTKAELMVKVLNGKRAIIFIDNFSDSLEAFNYLSTHKNIVLIGVERTHNFSTISHLIDISNFDICNVTELTDFDLQGIYDNLPFGSRAGQLNKEKRKDYENDTIFEFIKRNVKYNTIKSRFIEVFENLKKLDHKLTEFLVLTAYTHNCRVPISFEMLYSYFSDDLLRYDEVYDLRDQLNDLVKDYSGDLDTDEDQDYYYPRSYHIAETIIDTVDPEYLKQVMIKTLNNVPSVRVPHYNVFRKYAYAKTLVLKAFRKWEEGRDFYEKAYEMDFNNPYVLQQGALYLSAKKKYALAFEWIDRAITLTNNKYFSIRNSHAIILFEANIGNPGDNPLIRNQLDSSMEILEKCLYDDSRKVFHAIRYAQQSMEYLNRYYDSKAITYVEKAKDWLRKEYQERYWDKELVQTIKRLEQIPI